MNVRSEVAAAATLDAQRGDAGAPLAMPIEFDRGLFGFPQATSFLLAPTSREGFYWLQSTEHDALCFVLADPFVFFRGYVVDLPDIEAAYLGAKVPGNVVILVTVTLPDGSGRAASANLQGPIAINVRNRVGRQVILNQPGFGVREPFDMTVRQG